MKLFLDCEFNGLGGDLISMALVSGCGYEWYEVLPCDHPVEWVYLNVIPVLKKKPLADISSLSSSLENFLQQFSEVHIVADWPDDIRYFCEALITGPGERIDTPPLTMEVIRVDAKSECPHNALADARGIRDLTVQQAG